MSTKPTLELEHFLPYRITVLASRIATTFSRSHASKHDLSIPEWRVMATLGQYGRIPAREICDISQMDKAKVSRAVMRLTATRLVARKDNPNDSRSHFLELTAKGRNVHDQIVPIAKQLEQQLVSTLTPAELDTFNTVILKLGRQIDAMTPDAPDRDSHV